MVTQKRMSPLTALVLGVAGVCAVAIASGSAVVIYGLDVAGGNAESIVRFAENTVEGLPQLIESLPPAVGDILNDRRAPDYVRAIDVQVHFVTDGDGKRFRPALTIENKGEQVVSMLAVRVAALTESGVPVGEWTELAATPIALDDNDWRGPLLPGAQRHVLLGAWRAIDPARLASISPAVEISDVRVWCGNEAGVAAERLTAATE